MELANGKKSYIGIKFVLAKPMNSNEAKVNNYKVNDKDEDGYEVTYEDGYKSWCPKEVFEMYNTELKDMDNLGQTARMMISTNYKERFVAEYRQAKIRYKKLKSLCDKIEAYDMMTPEQRINCTWQPIHTCPLELLRKQQRYMGQYIGVLDKRALIEGIDLCTEE